MFVLPAELGARHASFGYFVLYTLLAAGLFACGEQAVGPHPHDLVWSELFIDTWVRGVALFVCGGTLFVLASTLS